MKLSKLKINPKNPQHFKDLTKLKISIEQFPKMMSLRKIIYDPKTGYVLGGNKRLVCLKEMGYKDIPDDWVKSAADLTEDEKKRFLIADNVGFGEWDWEELQENWDIEELDSWGLSLPEFDDDGPDQNQEEWIGMPDFEAEGNPFKIIINFKSEDLREQFAKENEMNFVKKESRTWSTWHPFEDRDDLSSLKYEEDKKKK